MRRRAFLGTVALVPVSGCTDLIGSDGDGVDGGDIGMSAHSFFPEEYHVSVGETVTWINSSSRGHTVTALDNQIPDEAEFFATGGYGSTSEAVEAWSDYGGGRLDAGETYEHTFDIPGTYEYYCIPHVASDMFGTVIVDD